MKKLSKLLLALSFVLSVTTSSYAVTVASWGGAYTESQKLGYGDPTAKKLGIEINWVDYSYLHSILLTDVTKVYLLNLILTKTSQLLQMEHLQVKISSQACLVNVL
jgi:hypothetical protein